MKRIYNFQILFYMFNNSIDKVLIGEIINKNISLNPYDSKLGGLPVKYKYFQKFYNDGYIQPNCIYCHKPMYLLAQVFSFLKNRFLHLFIIIEHYIYLDVMIHYVH